MNKSAKREKVIVAIILFLIAAITGLVFAFFPPVASFNKKWYVTATTKELELYKTPSDWPMYYLQFFRSLKTLRLYEPTKEDMKYIPDTKTLKDITISFGEITDASSVKALDCTEKLHFYGASFSFDNYSPSEVKYLSFESCGIFDLDRHGHFSKLEELSFDNCFFDYPEFSYTLTYDNPGQVLKDTSAFSDLASIKKLYFDRMTITDISGFTNMANLQEIIVGSGVFSDEIIDKLALAGIKVSTKS